MHLLRVTQPRSRLQLSCNYLQSCQGGVGGPGVGPKDTVRKRELHAWQVRSCVLARPAEATGQPWFYKARGWPEMFCFTNARRLIWGKFASL